MLLLVTNREDYTADWLVLELEGRGANFLRFNTEDYPSDIGLTWRPEGDARLHIEGREWRMQDFTAVWFRRPLMPELRDLEPDVAGWAEAEALEALNGLWRTHDALWVNDPQANWAADSKPEQLRTARQLGFEIPATLVTNSPEEARNFAASQPSGAVSKPLREGRVVVRGEEHAYYTTFLDSEDVAALGELGPEPYLLQGLVDKRYDVRVTVIDREAFAVRIESQDEPAARVDWRRAESAVLPHAVEELPEQVSRGCVALVRHYGLRFGAIDLARRPDGAHAFFELNPNGQWAWVEQLTGLPLRARLAELLLREEHA